jgi:hypothetical protein
VPVTFAEAGLPMAFPAMTIEPVLSPGLRGAKVTSISQLLPAAKVLPQEFLV